MVSVGLFGDQVIEFLLWNNSIVISISSLDHVLKSVIVSQLTEVFCNFSDVLQSNKSWIVNSLPVFWVS